MKEILNRLFEYKSLDRATAKEILSNLAQGKYNNSEMAECQSCNLLITNRRHHFCSSFMHEGAFLVGHTKGVHGLLYHCKSTPYYDN